MSELLTEEKLVKIVGAVWGNDGAPRLLDYSITRREKHGYLGDHFNLDLRVLVDGQQDEKSLFIKTYKIPAEGQMDFVGETGMFTKEVTIYRKIFRAFQNCTRLPKWAPVYYFSHHRLLALENLSEEGFVMKTDGKLLDKDHLEIALQALSVLHASALIFERKESVKLDAIFSSCFKEFLYEENNTSSPTFAWKRRQTQDIVAGIDFLDKYSTAQKEFIKKYIPSTIDKIYPLSKKSTKWTNVLVHGDMWSNNILFKYSEGKPVDCRLVDYQFSRYAPAMHDVMHVLHLTTDREFRAEHEDKLVKNYYENLKTNLSAHDMDIEEYYPWEEFLKSKNDYKLLALIQSLLSLHYSLGGRKVQNDPKFDKWKSVLVDEYLNENRTEIVKEFFADKKYAERIGGILYQLIDEYILNDSQRELSGISL